MKNIIGAPEVRLYLFQIANILLNKLGLFIYLRLFARKKIVNNRNRMTLFNQGINQIRADESGPTGNNDFVFVSFGLHRN